MSQDKYYGDAGLDSLEVGGNSPIYSFLTRSIQDGKALADDGKAYDSVDTAENNASSFVMVAPGTFSESVTIETSGLTIIGSGYDTLIDAGSGSDAISVSSATDVTIKNLSVRTDAGQGSSYNPLSADSNSNGLTVMNVTVRNADAAGIACDGAETFVKNVTVENGDSGAIDVGGSRSIISGCYMDGVGGRNLQNSDDGITANNVVLNSGDRSINEGNSAAITIGNRVHNSGDDGIYVNVSSNILIANNRVSDSAGSDLNIQDSDTTTDDNLTGTAN